MPRKPAPLRPIETAPHDRPIEVETGRGERVVARWSHQNQAWVGAEDPLRRTLHGVTGWREV